MLIKCEDKKRLYRKIAAAAIPTYFLMMAIAAYYVIDFGQLTGDYQVAYYHMGIYGNICFLAFVFGWLSICYLISLYIPKGILAYLTKLCKNITKIYVIQFSRKVSQPEEGKNHSSSKLAVILSDCTEIATGDAASLRYGI